MMEYWKRNKSYILEKLEEAETLLEEDSYIGFNENINLIEIRLKHIREKMNEEMIK